MKNMCMDYFTMVFNLKHTICTNEKRNVTTFQNGLASTRQHKHLDLVNKFSQSMFGLILLLTLLQDCAIWTSVNAQNFQKYHWKADSWGPCVGDICGYGGMQLRAVTCNDEMFDKSRPRSHCSSNDEPLDKKTCFKVCDFHKDQFSWEMGEWSPCTRDSCEGEESLCGDQSSGTQVRGVRCVNLTNESLYVDDYICHQLFPVPPARRPCIIPRPVSCVTSAFGAWSDCEATCGNAIRARFRRILRPASFGGEGCPTLSETQRCQDLPPCPGQVSRHTLKFGEWTKCKKANINVRSLFSGGGRKERNSRRLWAKVVRNLVGVRSQTVSCLDGFGAELGNNITLMETCPLSVSCLLSDWSEWSSCNASCGEDAKKIRTRNILRLPQGVDTEACPVTMETKSCDIPLYALPTCYSYKWISGRWGGCELIHNVSCGGGIRTRNVFCIQQDYTTEEMLKDDVESAEMATLLPVDPLKCDKTNKPEEWQECDVTCPLNCDMGQWSDWSECALPHCPGDPGSQGFRMERSAKKRSGFKRRVRTIHNDFRSREDCPHTLEVIPCSSARCGPHNTQPQHNPIVVAPGCYNVNLPSQTREKDGYSFYYNCFSWNLAELTPCQHNRGTCGSGTQVQLQICRDMWGNAVDDRMCRDSASLPRTRRCHTSCPTDCVMSDWGAWSPCENSCQQRRKDFKLQIRKRFVVANNGPNGSPCPSNDNHTLESRPCNDHKCSVFYWNKHKWGDCQLESNNTAGSNLASGLRTEISPSAPLSNSPLNIQSCGVGFQTRRVVCKKKRSGKVKPRFCLGWDKPSSIRRCRVKCDRDCMLSQWSEWSRCDDDCKRIADNNLTGLDLAYQHRQRYVIQDRIGMGEPCLREVKQSRVCPDEQQCTLYRWQMSSWSPCILPVGMTTAVEDDESCIGLNTRMTSCVRVFDGRPSDLSLCIQGAGDIPHATRPCLTECGHDSAFNKWQQRIGCQAAVSEFVTAAVQEEEEVTSASTPIPNNPTAKPIGQWSSCFVDQASIIGVTDDCVRAARNRDGVPALPSLSAPSCGQGRRRRALGCFEEGTDVMFEIKYCNYPTYAEEECEVPCPLDCEMSEWTGWGGCGDLTQISPSTAAPASPPPCGHSLRVRYKYPDVEPMDGGRTCPSVDHMQQVYETQLCLEECEDVFWVSSNWNTCASGDQAQSVDCYKTMRSSSLSNLARPVNDMTCPSKSKPPTSRACDMPSPDACVMSEWSAWQDCVRPDETRAVCDGASRKRTRRVLRQHTPESTSPCPDQLTETEDCLLNVNCFTFSWKWSSWSSCTIDGARCGRGVRRRRANCVRSDLSRAALSKCTINNVTVPPHQFIDCRVDCPIDCQLSDWTSWSSCSATCGTSRVRTRQREITREARGGGRACPEELTQRLPCCAKPCFTWKLLEWGECFVPGSNCGNGAQEREAACVQENDVKVDPMLCKLEQRRLSGGSGRLYDRFGTHLLSRPCRIPCPGECAFSQWLLWGECYGGQRCQATGGTGRRTRTQVQFGDETLTRNCSSFNVEEEECTDPTCYTYQWKRSYNATGGWKVWCEREQDGLVVASGCSNDVKPKVKNESCVQDCELIQHGYCSEMASECDCTLPYYPLYDVDETLLHCIDPDKDYQSPEDEEEVTTLAAPTSPYNITATTQQLDTWLMFNPLNDDGSLKIWAYGAIAGILVLLIFIVAVGCRTYAACRRGRGKTRRSSSNVGMIVTATGGSTAYGPGGNGLPPYYVSSSKAPPRYTQCPVRAMSRESSSSKSVYSYGSRYDGEMI